MKKNKIIILVLVTVLCMFINLGKVWADAYFWNANNGMQTKTSYGLGDWLSQYIGFKVTVYSSVNYSKYSGIIVNQKPWAYYSSKTQTQPTVAFYGKATSSLDSGGTNVIIYDKAKVTYSGVSFPSDYCSSTNSDSCNFIDLDKILSGTDSSPDYRLLINLLDLIGYTTDKYSPNDYVIVEPMVYISSRTKRTTYNCKVTTTTYKYGQKVSSKVTNKNNVDISTYSFESTTLSNYLKTGTLPKLWQAIEYDCGTENISYVENNHYFLTAYEFYNNNDVNSETFTCGAGVGFSWCYDSVFRDLSDSLNIGNNYLSKVNMKNYSDTITCVENSDGGCAIGLYGISNINPKGTLTINKIKSDGTPISKGLATFKIYGNLSDCGSNSNALGTFTNGNASKELTSGQTYYYKEISAPSGYVTDDTCYSINLSSGNNSITLTNKTQCEIDFDSKNSDGSVTMQERLELYKTYSNYNGLLNTNNTQSYNACKPVNCSNDSSTSCLAGNTASNTFSSSNLSCYNDKLTIHGSDVGYCFTTFNLTNNLGITNFSTKSGQMYINTNGIVTTGVLTKTCYVYSMNGYVSNYTLPYSDYVKGITFGGEELSYTVGEPISTTSNDLRTYSISATYKFNPIYVSIGTGRRCSGSEFDSCVLVGSGMLSKLVDNGTYPIDFKIQLNELNYNNKSSFKINDIKDEDKCTYTAIPEIVDISKDKLNIEFRIIDTNNPFPGRSGNGRNTATNWCGSYFKVNADINGDQDITVRDVLLLRRAIAGLGTLTEEQKVKADINKDGIIDMRDIVMLRREIGGLDNCGVELITEESEETIDCTVKNSNVCSVITNGKNSYSNDPVYRIVLDSETIKDIKEYNSTHSYDDYETLDCSNGWYCESTFLNTLSTDTFKDNKCESTKNTKYEDLCNEYKEA